MFSLITFNSRRSALRDLVASRLAVFAAALAVSVGGPAYASPLGTSTDHASCKCGGTQALVLKGTTSSWQKLITVPKGAELTLKMEGVMSFDGPDDINALKLTAKAATVVAGGVATIICGDCSQWVAILTDAAMSQAIKTLANAGASMIHDEWGIDVQNPEKIGSKKAGGILVRIGASKSGTHDDCPECEVSNVYHLVKTTATARFGSKYAKYHKCITPAALAAKVKAAGATIYVKVFDQPGGFADNSGRYGLVASIE